MRAIVLLLLIGSTIGQVYNLMCKGAIEVDVSKYRLQSISIQVANSVIPLLAGVLIDLFGIKLCAILMPLPMILSSAMMFTRPDQKDAENLDDVIEPMFEIGQMATLVAQYVLIAEWFVGKRGASLAFGLMMMLVPFVFRIVTIIRH